MKDKLISSETGGSRRYMKRAVITGSLNRDLPSCPSKSSAVSIALLPTRPGLTSSLRITLNGVRSQVQSGAAEAK